MKLSDYIEKYGNCEVTGEIDKCIVKKSKTVYDLKYGDRYFFLTASGIIQGAFWHDDISDLNRLSIGNISLTEEAAEFARERLEVIAELKKYAKEFSDEEWDNGNLRKHCIMFDYSNCRLNISFTLVLKSPEIYFESEEKAQEAIESVGEDRVKKYYLEVKE